MAKTIYKILPDAMWREVEKSGVFAGAPIDLQDGFIHFSPLNRSRKQPPSTLPARRDC